MKSVIPAEIGEVEGTKTYVLWKRSGGRREGKEKGQGENGIWKSPKYVLAGVCFLHYLSAD